MLKKVFGLAKRVAKSSAFKNIAKAGVAELPGLVGKLSGNVKKKRLKSILDFDITKTGLDLMLDTRRRNKLIFLGVKFFFEG